MSRTETSKSRHTEIPNIHTQAIFTDKYSRHKFNMDFFFKNNNSLIGKINFLEEEMEIIKNKLFEENNDKYL